MFITKAREDDSRATEGKMRGYNKRDNSFNVSVIGFLLIIFLLVLFVPVLIIGQVYLSGGYMSEDDCTGICTSNGLSYSGISLGNQCWCKTITGIDVKIAEGK